MSPLFAWRGAGREETSFDFVADLPSSPTQAPAPMFLLLRVFAACRVNPKRGVGDEALLLGVNRSRALPDPPDGVKARAVPPTARSGGFEDAVRSLGALSCSAMVMRVGIVELML